MNTLKATWGGGSDSMRSYVIGEHVLHTYGLKGKHPTLSFAADVDMNPSSLFETVDTALHDGAVKTPSTQSLAIADYPRVGEVHGVDIYPKIHNVSLTACRGGGVSARLGAPNGSLAIENLVPIPFKQSFHGNGTDENSAVKSTSMILEFGIPLSLQRWLTARDTATLARLLSNGIHPKAKIELVDSATGVVLVVLDSIEITTAHDTLNHDGTLNYMPDEDFVGFPVYVRARVTGDTSVAEWRVSSHVEFGWNPSDLGFAKSAMQDRGRAGLVPIGTDPIDLVIYPNPLRPRARVMYTVPIDDGDQVIEVRVFTIMGADITTLVHAAMPAGRHAVEFSGADLNSGEYVVAVHTQNHMSSRMVNVVR